MEKELYNSRKPLLIEANASSEILATTGAGLSDDKNGTINERLHNFSLAYNDLKAKIVSLMNTDQTIIDKYFDMISDLKRINQELTAQIEQSKIAAEGMHTQLAGLGLPIPSDKGGSRRRRRHKGRRTRR